MSLSPAELKGQQPLASFSARSSESSSRRPLMVVSLSAGASAMVSSIAFEGLSSDLPSLSSDLSWRDASRRPNLVADFERDSGGRH